MGFITDVSPRSYQPSFCRGTLEENFSKEPSLKQKKMKPICCSIIPPHMKKELQQKDDVKEMFSKHDHDLRKKRIEFVPSTQTTSAISTQQTTARVLVYNVNRSDYLPGSRVSNPQYSKDKAIQEAYRNASVTRDVYYQAFNRKSIDNRNMDIVSCVHYERSYDNAFWDGRRMVYGDGDELDRGDAPKIFNRFTKSLDVAAHEMTHGVTQYSGNNEYKGSSGATNESISDVFGSIIKQKFLNQTVEQADWLIGQELLRTGEAIRSLAAPGTAYDNEYLGKDPQPSAMDGYVVTEEDNEGVHINSGIPNHSFYLANRNLSRKRDNVRSWQEIGQIWYRAYRYNTSDTGIFEWANHTIRAAEELYGAQAVETESVVAAWKETRVIN